MSGPRTVILCGGAPRHLYVANRLCQAADVRVIITETGSRITATKLWQQTRKGLLWRKLWRKLRDIPRYAGNSEAAFFFGDSAPALTRPSLRTDVASINDPQVVALLREVRPEVMAVFGTSLLGPEVLFATQAPVINLHGGLSPWYRGADCTFWALYNGEPERVGCTLHFIDAGIDTGRLLAHVYPEVGPGDDELTLFWRGVRDSAEVYAQTLPGVAQGALGGEIQPKGGRLYQVRDRLWRHERRLRRDLAAGLIDRTLLDARVTRFGDGWPRFRPVASEDARAEAWTAGFE